MPGRLAIGELDGVVADASLPELLWLEVTDRRVAGHLSLAELGESGCVVDVCWFGHAALVLMTPGVLARVEPAGGVTGTADLGCRSLWRGARLAVDEDEVTVTAPQGRWLVDPVRLTVYRQPEAPAWSESATLSCRLAGACWVAETCPAPHRSSLRTVIRRLGGEEQEGPDVVELDGVVTDLDAAADGTLWAGVWRPLGEAGSIAIIDPTCEVAAVIDLPAVGLGSYLGLAP